MQRTLDPYPKDNIRYTPTVEESIERLNATTYEQVAQLHRDFLGSQAGELTIVGDFDPETCLPVLKGALADWNAAKPYARIASPIVAEVPGSEQKIATPDKANATYVAGLLFPMRDDDADYPALVMGNYMFGGGALSSRLATRVRQHEGLSYSVGSSLNVSAEDARASFNIAAIANPENIAKLEQSVQDELDRLLREGVTAEELDKARQGYLQAIQVGRASDPALAVLLNELSHLRRTMGWQADFEKKIGELTPEQVNAALRRHIDPKKLVMVVAGDFDPKPAGDGKANNDGTKPGP